MGANDRESSTLVRIEGKVSLSPIAKLVQSMETELSDYRKLIFFQQRGKIVFFPTTFNFSSTRALRRVIMGANDRAWSTLVRMEHEESRSPIARLAQWMVFGVSAYQKIIFCPTCGKMSSISNYTLFLIK